MRRPPSFLAPRFCYSALRMGLVILCLLLLSFLLSLGLTAVVRKVAVRVGFVDRPGHRKIHSNPKPLGGGVAIFAGVVVPLLGIVAGALPAPLFAMGVMTMHLHSAILIYGAQAAWMALAGLYLWSGWFAKELDV